MRAWQGRGQKGVEGQVEVVIKWFGISAEGGGENISPKSVNAIFEGLCWRVGIWEEPCGHHLVGVLEGRYNWASPRESKAMGISRAIAEQMEHSSWIRRMFEIGIELRKERGAENVFDFTLGNPDVEPPEAVI